MFFQVITAKRTEQLPGDPGRSDSSIKSFVSSIKAGRECRQRKGSPYCSSFSHMGNGPQQRNNECLTLLSIPNTTSGNHLYIMEIKADTDCF